MTWTLKRASKWLLLVLVLGEAKLSVSEPRLFTCLFRWIFGRTYLREGEFGYHKKSWMIFIVMMVVMTSPVELLVFELVVPWAWLRLLLLILGVYTVFWFLGFHASHVALPHRLEAEGLRLRRGIFAEAFIPYREIKSVERRRRKSPKDAAYLAINGNTDLTPRLERPLQMRGFFRSTRPVGTIHAAADKPEKLVRELRLRLREVPAPDGPPLVTS